MVRFPPSRIFPGDLGGGGQKLGTIAQMVRKQKESRKARTKNRKGGRGGGSPKGRKAHFNTRLIYLYLRRRLFLRPNLSCFPLSPFPPSSLAHSVSARPSVHPSFFLLPNPLSGGRKEEAQQGRNGEMGKCLGGRISTANWGVLFK